MNEHYLCGGDGKLKKKKKMLGNKLKGSHAQGSFGHRVRVEKNIIYRESARNVFSAREGKASHARIV